MLKPQKRSGRFYLLLLCLLLSLSACQDDKGQQTESSQTGQHESDSQQNASAPVSTLDAAAARNLLQKHSDMTILDVRTPGEFSDGHLKQATNLDFHAGDFETRLAALDPQKPYLVYCASGKRSQQAAEMMQAKGFTQVNDLAGGIAAWQGAGGAVER